MTLKPRAFHEAKPRAVQKRSHEPWRPGQTVQDPGHFGAGEDDRKPCRPPSPHEAVEPSELDSQYFAVEEEDRAQGLVLRRRADVPLDREMREERGDLRLSQLPWMAHPVEPDVAMDPSDVRLLGPGTVPVESDGRAHLREQSRGFPSGVDPAAWHETTAACNDRANEPEKWYGRPGFGGERTAGTENPDCPIRSARPSELRGRAPGSPPYPGESDKSACKVSRGVL